VSLDLEATIEALAKTTNDWREAIHVVAQQLSDEDLLLVVKECERLSQPTSSRNFPMLSWAEIEKTLRFERALREIDRKASKYMAETGATVYCVHCEGACTPEHLAEL